MKYRNTATPARFLLVLLMVLLTGSAHAAEEPGHQGAVWQILKSDAKSLEMVFQMPTPGLKEVQAADQVWHTLDIPGAVVHGSIGEPGLPVVSRLVALPQGTSLSVELISASKTIMSDLKIFPVQDPAGEEFSFSAAAYSQKTSLPATGPEIKVGRPAILAGQMVVPLTLNPVQYDPTQGQAVIWTEAHLKLEFISDPGAPTARTTDRPLPMSFVKQMENQVLGFSRDNLKSSGAPVAAFGTYVAIYGGDLTVRTNMAPLLEWRRLQGYHVVELSSALSNLDPEIIKDSLQSIYDNQNIPPLEFITIFGDAVGSYSVPTWYEDLSGYNGGGDHYYTTLDGDDILADVHIGRVSFLNTNELTTVVNKILGYEKTPPVDDAGWFGRACLQGDPSASGITTIYTNQWLKGQLFAHGWTQVDTTWSGNFVNPMMAQVGQGVSVYGYRGYLGTSGISNGHVMSLANGGRLAMALLPTCDSGSFASSATCRSEAWLRAPNGGAVAAIGTATVGTHTRYNNCYYVGTWDGLLNGGDHRIGVAHTLGKMALYSGYYLAEPHRAEIWAVWNNIMGDAATEIWTSVPGTLDVDYPTHISQGAQALTISVSQAGMPVAEARVCLLQTDGPFDEFQVTALTDQNGQVVLNLPNQGASSAWVTVTKHDHLPHLGGLTIGQVDVFCAATGRIINEGSFNPGQTVSLTPSLTNHGSNDAFGVSAQVTVQDGPATVTAGSLTFGSIAAGSEVAASGPITLDIAPDAEDGAIIRLLLTATDGSESWTSILEETVQAAVFSVTTIDLSDFGGSLDEGESGRFDLTLENQGNLNATAVSATLSSHSPWIIISDELAEFGDISMGGNGWDLLSPFLLTVSPACYGGHLATFELAINYSDGMQALAQCAVVVGTADSDQPTGPDSYGYFAYDNTDNDSQMAPEYNWVAIDPDHGSLGTDLGLTDFGWEQDDTKTITLPFNFPFYGTAYDKISICSNGWMAMGTTPLNFYRNFPLPASHSAGALIAPFWDDLRQSGNHKVYTWYDEDGHRFVIQWYGMTNNYSNSPQNFEAILLDPAHHATSTGDGMILFQYQQVNNTDSRDGYATVGIQNMERNDGLNYSYWNQYAAGASSLVAGRAILFAPLGQIALPAMSVTPGSLAQTLMPGQQVTEYLHISNTGDDGSTLNFSIDKVDPITQVLDKTIDDPEEPVVVPSSISGSQVSSSTTAYIAGGIMNLPLHVNCSSPDNEWLWKMELDLPDGVTVNSATDLSTPQGPMTWNGEVGTAVTTSWGDISVGGSDGFLADNQSGDASVNLGFAADLTGDLVINWSVYGDNFGGLPHNVSGEIVLGALSPSISVTEPAHGDLTVIGDELSVAFTAINGPTMVTISLQREADGPWQNLAFALPADSSPWSWTVSGEPGPYARIRVSDSGNASVFGLSGIFGVGRNLDWLQLSTQSGQVDAGQTLDLALTLDSVGLDNGLHEANLVINNNGGLSLTVPVALTVSSTSPVTQLPTVVALLGNHPNPFNPQTVISFSLPTQQDVTLRIYSARGRLVQSLLRGSQPAGLHHAVWDGRDDRGRGVASGVYFYRLQTGEESFTGKMVLAK